ncbi:MAG TPA: tRNA preQ1(34) S-adenosylmethionine ribosyltransferase-isomerase QueA [Polyangia bacterium]
MRIQDFDYDLPPELIAVRPAERRDAARLLLLDISTGLTQHASFRDISVLLRPRSLLVLNDTKVIPARLFARKPSGGRVEIFLVRRRATEDWAHSNRSSETWKEMWDVLLRSAAGMAVGGILSLDGGITATIAARGERGAATLAFEGTTSTGGLLGHAERHGVIPLPPYIEAARRRELGVGEGTSAQDDRERYQTVFAKSPGAVAAPTAGLHFTDELLARVQEGGHEIAKLTLHVGPGTFRTVEVEDPKDHQMDAEAYEVPAATAEALNRARAEGRPIVAVGTTVVRTLETIAANSAGTLRAEHGMTDIFLMPGSPFRLVTDLVTNFHLPRSTLLMLVSAFAGREPVLRAYAEAIAARYRFYSYGDAMLLRGPRREGESS